ncbi:transcriptional Coactivator p15-domain-containing protein [Earliella scabrosa]|nr:transcriptional Coactivator p15-domain-containing protein [Earliella scabrosa]
MAKRKQAISSSDEEDDGSKNAALSSPERPLQTARRTGKKAKKETTTDEESEEEAPVRKPAKKAKAVKQPSIKKPKAPTPDEDEAEDTGDVHVGVNDRGERYVDLGKKRRATVNTFKGGKYLDIREFYGDESDLKPGKKGISLNQEQWETLKKSSDVIDSFFAKLK